MADAAEEIVWLTAHQAADLLGMKEQTLRLRRGKRWTKEDRGPQWYRVGGAVRYKKHEVLAYIDARAGAPRPRRPRPLASAPR